jgi:hypothetical protein
MEKTKKVYRNGKEWIQGDHLKAKEIIKDFDIQVGNFGPNFEIENRFKDEEALEKIEKGGFCFRIYKYKSMPLFFGNGTPPNLGAEREEVFITYERI